MGAYLATPPLPWAYNQGGVIILRDKYVSLQDIIHGAVVFKIKDNHGSVSNATVVQYPSDQKYYLQASGSMLWQLGDISQAVNRIELIATGNIPQGFSLVGVTVQEPTYNYAIEIYANQQCTQRPISGQRYIELYAKLNRSYGMNEAVSYGTGENGCVIDTPTDQYPTDPYEISCYVDYRSGSLEQLNIGVYHLNWDNPHEGAPEFNFDVNFGLID